MREVTDADKLYYFSSSFVSLDGLWMLEIEKEIGWDRALKIDVTVWTRLFKIIIRRLKRYLNIETNNLNDLVEILTFRWSIEGWKYNVNRISDTEVLIEVSECPYKGPMERNPERRDKIPLICKGMCFPFYKAVFNDFNPKIVFKREKAMGLGDDVCTFHFKLQ